MYSFYKNNTENSILGIPAPTAGNGRVDLSQINTDALFKMQEKIAVKNKASDYRDALNGTWVNTTLSDLFFSSKNIQILQNAIRSGVYEKSNQQYIVAMPNIDTLKIIMRSTFLQYAEHLPDQITEQIQRLNKRVLDFAIDSTYGEAVSYQKYMQDQSTLVVPLETPLQHDRTYKQLELKPWF